MSDALDLRDGLDGMQADMAAHQRRFAGEVSAEANRVLAAEAFERLDRQLAEAAPAPAPVAVEAPPVVERTEHREVDGRRYLVDVARADDTAMRIASPAEHWFLSHAMPRVDLLMTKVDTGPMGQPSWRDRVLAVLEYKSRVQGLKAAGLHDLAADVERRFVFELVALLDDSDRLFGPWKADAPDRKIMVSG